LAHELFLAHSPLPPRRNAEFLPAIGDRVILPNGRRPSAATGFASSPSRRRYTLQNLPIRLETVDRGPGRGLQALTGIEPRAHTVVETLVKRGAQESTEPGCSRPQAVGGWARTYHFFLPFFAPRRAWRQQIPLRAGNRRACWRDQVRRSSGHLTIPRGARRPRAEERNRPLLAGRAGSRVRASPAICGQRSGLRRRKSPAPSPSLPELLKTVR